MDSERKPQSDSDLWEHLVWQLDFLRSSLDRYEAGVEPEALRSWPWELGRDSEGAGRVKVDGHTRRVRSLAAEHVLGPPGRGQIAVHTPDPAAVVCWNPAHLAWRNRNA